MEESSTSWRSSPSPTNDESRKEEGRKVADGTEQRGERETRTQIVMEPRSAVISGGAHLADKEIGDTTNRITVNEFLAERRYSTETVATEDTRISGNPTQKGKKPRSTISNLITELRDSGRGIHDYGKKGEQEIRVDPTQSTSCNDTTRELSGADEHPSIWTKAGNLFKAISMLCHVGCPPVPAHIVRKVAFHPPPKDSGYILRLKDGKKVHNASEINGRPFSLEPVAMRGLQISDYDSVMRRIETTIVRTKHGTDLVVIRTRVASRPKNERLRNQVLLMTQPNSSDIGHFIQPHCVSFAHVSDALEMDVYAFDYSGFGYSSGRPSESNMYRDTQAVFDYIGASRPEMSIALLGYSIGTAAAIDTACRHACQTEISGIMLIAPFTSGLRLLSSNPASEQTCCLDPFTNTDKISSIDAPILIIHGTEDAMVPISHTTALVSRLRRPTAPFIVQGADHQNVFSCPSTFDRMNLFLRSETIVNGVTMSQPAGPTEKDLTDMKLPRLRSEIQKEGEEDRISTYSSERISLSSRIFETINRLSAPSEPISTPKPIRAMISNTETTISSMGRENSSDMSLSCSANSPVPNDASTSSYTGSLERSKRPYINSTPSTPDLPVGATSPRLPDDAQRAMARSLPAFTPPLPPSGILDEPKEAIAVVN